MNDLDRALSDIVEIRSRIAASTEFRGLGPAAVAATAGLAVLTAGGQALALAEWTDQPLLFLGIWCVTAVLAVAAIGLEMLRRSRQQHDGIADAMIVQAAQQFLPFGIAGAALLVVFARFAPEALWTLPGLWQVLMGLGIFASLRSLPRSVVVAGGWYFLSGFAVLMAASGSHALSPWAMGIPFAVGQALMAGSVYLASRGSHGRE